LIHRSFNDAVSSTEVMKCRLRFGKSLSLHVTILSWNLCGRRKENHGSLQ